MEKRYDKGTESYGRFPPHKRPGLQLYCEGDSISENTIKSFCQRQSVTVRLDADEHGCPYCGATVVQTPRRKEKKFCTDKCRSKWWNANPNQVDRMATHVTTRLGGILDRLFLFLPRPPRTLEQKIRVTVPFLPPLEHKDQNGISSHIP